MTTLSNKPDTVLVFATINGKLRCGRYSVDDNGNPDKLIEEVQCNENTFIPGKYWIASSSKEGVHQIIYEKN